MLAERYSLVNTQQTVRMPEKAEIIHVIFYIDQKEINKLAPFLQNYRCLVIQVLRKKNSITTFAYQFSAWLDWLSPPPAIPTSDYEFIIYPKCTVRKIVIFSPSLRIISEIIISQPKESKNGQV